MKKNILFFVVLSMLIVSSCSKSTTDISTISKPDLLLNQLKSEPKFLEYLTIVRASIQILSENIDRSSLKDSVIIRDKSLTFSEKYEQLKLTGLQDLENLSKKSNALIVYLTQKYPLYSELTNDESKLFYKKAVAYYFTPKK